MRPLEGRRLWFVGIGGAGLSAYAAIASAWGAEVGGWDRVDTAYLDALREHELVIAPDPVVPDGWEVVVSTAYADRVEGLSRAAFLAELVSLRETVVVAGAHGKTTTTGMIAYALAQLGRDPAYAIGGEIPQLGGNAGTGDGWFVVEGDESDRTIAALRPQVAVVLNVELDHHSEFASLAEVQALFDDWTSHVPHVVRAEELEPVDFELAQRGEHNRRNAAAALAALELCGVVACGRDAARRCVPGRGAPVPVARRGRRRPRLRRLRPSPDRGRRDDLDRARGRHGPRARPLPAAPLLAHASPRARVRTRARRRRRRRGRGRVRGARARRRSPRQDRRRTRCPTRAAGARVGWMPSREQGARWLASLARPGDVVLTVGAGDVDGAVPVLLEALA